MDNDETRFDRNERFFGREGQKKIQKVKVLVIGAGGIGSHVIQQLALLGVIKLGINDDEDLSESNRNRYVTARHDDPVPGSRKVQLAKRLVDSIDPQFEVELFDGSIVSEEGFGAIKRADIVICCVDSDGVRYVVNEACLAYDKPLFDLATDVPEPNRYGGRVAVVWDNGYCLHCRDLLDPEEVRRFLASDEARGNEAEIYGVDRAALGEKGPSVVSLNGVVASLGVTEFMVAVTGMRKPCSHLEYRAHMGVVTKPADPEKEGCHFCDSVKGAGDSANIKRYIK